MTDDIIKASFAYDADWPDDFRWLIAYGDGTGVLEGMGVAFGELDFSKIALVTLIPQRPHLQYISIETPFDREEQRISDPAYRPIFFRRRAHTIKNAETENPDVTRRTFTALGWQTRVAGWNVKHVLFISPEGMVVATSEPDSYEVW